MDYTARVLPELLMQPYLRIVFFSFCSCDEDDCPTTYSNGLTGRVCDESCADGDPYGTNGCSAVDGKYGDYCRTCYFDRDRAISRDDPDDRAIM